MRAICAWVWGWALVGVGLMAHGAITYTLKWIVAGALIAVIDGAVIVWWGRDD